VSDKIGVVFVEPDFLTIFEFLISTPRTFGQHTLAGLVLGDDFPNCRAFGVEYSGARDRYRNALRCSERGRS